MNTEDLQISQSLWQHLGCEFRWQAVRLLPRWPKRP